jgi:AP2 domain
VSTEPAAGQQHELSAATASAAYAELSPEERAALDLRFERISRTFALVYFIDDEINLDAHVIRIKTGAPVNPPPLTGKGMQSVWLENGPPQINESFYKIKLALHLGCWPIPMVDHVKGREDEAHRDRLSRLRVLNAQDNARNRKSPRKVNKSLPKGVNKMRNRKGIVIAYQAHAYDENGRMKHLGYFSIAKYGDELARRHAFEARHAYAQQHYGKAYREPRKRAA